MFIEKPYWMLLKTSNTYELCDYSHPAFFVGNLMGFGKIVPES